MALGFFSSRSVYLRWLRNGLLTVNAIAALLGTGLAAGLSKSDWASWVQAVGSIGAIIGAVWVGYRQSKQQREQFQRQMRAEHERQSRERTERTAKEMHRANREANERRRMAQQRLLVQHRRVSRAATELVGMFRRGLDVHVHMSHPRIDVAEVTDLRARLRAIEDDDLPQELETIIAVMRDLMGVAVAQQHRWSAPVAAEAELGLLHKRAQENSVRAHELLASVQRSQRVPPPGD